MRRRLLTYLMIKSIWRLFLVALCLAVPASAQTRARVQTPVVPIIGGLPFSAAALIGLRAPSLSAATLPSVSLRAPTLGSAIPALPSAPRVAQAAFFAPLGVKAAASYAAAPEAKKPVVAALEAVAKPFASAEGRASAQAGSQLALAFDASRLPRADAPADVIAGVRRWPRAAGVGLARPFNGIEDETKAETPAPKNKPSEEKPMTRWQSAGAGILLALCLAGSLFMWYQLYAGFADMAGQAEYQLRQGYDQYYGPIPDIGDIFR